jgi:2-methylcitrate dehydratase PrpD
MLTSFSVQNHPGIAHYLAHLIGQIKLKRFSEKDCSIVHQHMLDAIAAAFIGRRNKVFDDLTELCAKLAKGCGWPGSGTIKVHPLDAAMIWAFAINASVFEDGSREGACHPAAAVIPTIIALSNGKSWETIDQAAIAGYDVMVRLARSGNPQFTQRGFHPTAITAPFGAAATASLLLGYDLLTTENALCLAAMGSSGLMSSFLSGQTQPLQVAWSVRSGVASAMMAGAGHSGYPHIFEEGFYPAYLGNPPAVPIDQPLEHEYAVRGSYLKPYPGCRHLHPSLDALAEILKENQIDPSEIEKIKVRTYRVAAETEIHGLKERGDAYFNIAYALAARMVLGKSDWDAFDKKHFTNERLIEVMKRVNVLIDPEVDALYPGQRGSIVEVHKVNGNMIFGRVSYPLGEPESPLPKSATREKFRQAAKDYLSKKIMDRIETMLDVSRIPDSPEKVFKALSKPLGKDGALKPPSVRN